MNINFKGLVLNLILLSTKILAVFTEVPAFKYATYTIIWAELFITAILSMALIPIPKNPNPQYIVLSLQIIPILIFMFNGWFWCAVGTFMFIIFSLACIRETNNSN